jgi:hypothetical protein
VKTLRRYALEKFEPILIGPASRILPDLPSTNFTKEKQAKMKMSSFSTNPAL